MHSTFDKSSINSALRLRSSKNLVYNSRHPYIGTRTKAVTDITWFSIAWIQVMKQCLQCLSTVPLHTMWQQGKALPEDAIPLIKK